MPTKNPRLTITLQPSLAAQLRRLSELTGNSQSALISELLSGSGVVFDRMIALLEAAQKAKESIRGRIAPELDAAQEKMQLALGLALEGFDDISASLLDEAEEVNRRSRKRVPGRASATVRAAGSAGEGAPPRGEGATVREAATPLSNRGVRSDPKTRKTHSKSTGYAISLSKSEQGQKQAKKPAKKGAA
jgi:hypothetical protein